jgi:xanthine/CO dehydrogenase XdhC/CoxF family maturation factor
MICAGSQRNLAMLLMPDRDRGAVAAVVGALEAEEPGFLVLSPGGVAIELEGDELPRSSPRRTPGSIPQSPSPDSDSGWIPASAGMTVDAQCLDENGQSIEAFPNPSPRAQLVDKAQKPRSSPRRTPGSIPPSPSPELDAGWITASAGMTVDAQCPDEKGQSTEAFPNPSPRAPRVENAQLPQSSPPRRRGPSPLSPPDPGAYREPLQNPRRIAIFGGGHCGQALARQMSLVGYDALLLETRAAVLPADAAALGAGVVVRVVNDFREAAATVPRPEQTVAVVMTTDFPNDVRALEGALRQPFPFLGVMGSPAKITEIRARLPALGFSETDLERLVAPVGLPIGSRTPPEIAVSVAAQILAVRDKF